MAQAIYETHTITWQGIAIDITFEANWHNLNGFCPAHITLTSADREPLPVTGTGYLSHFTDPAFITEAGGPIAYVLAELDAAAKRKKWVRHVEDTRQLSLF